ncbi:Coatomer protein complex, alpha sub-unit [Ectocarpus siliculosus]|uniref:AP-1 complex subunit gamma n=1 Tax=Ectocarpus siliculosus TaxID=2880 RepID=D7FKE1_ECTSI|nr:Coatomer protein complex, alpha sub-unit [Ectocarpus siliculosus]|eukprot:CBJ29344.1 Coatomer protein complex, alpha sub-unit [Ectocarpus siliculosus]
MSVKQVLSEALGGIQGANQPRGLHNFIQEIRLCSNPTQEQQRVDKELANIRNKFSSSSGLSSYNRKKYVWKLVYMFMLGYEIDFGHMEMISLISSTKYSEKNVGYVAVSLLLRSGDTMMSLVINSIRNDLNSHSSPAQTLALATVANLGGNDLSDALLPDVERLLVMKGTDPAVRKKAALCFLRFFRENPGNLVHSELSDKMARLLENKNLGVVTSVMSLLIGLASRSPGNYEGLVPHVIHLLTRLVIHKACASEYLYYGTPSPWMHVKLLKFLQMFPPPADGSQREKLDEALEKIITKTEISASVNKSNADHCILFEAVNVIIHHGRDSNEELRSKAMTLLGRFIAVKEPNIRYLGLEVMSRLARLEGNETAKKHQATVLMSLKDADISIRRRALDLLFVMADETNGAEIVEELVTYLAASGAAIREEMVLKIAILAEKFTDDLNWYVDKMLEMIAVAGDSVAGAVWHRIIQIVTNHKDLQAYAAERLFATLQSPRAHETAVNIGGYILGEFGYFIAEQDKMSGQDQFHVLHQHFMEVGPAAKALLLSTYAKLANLYPECRELVTPVFERFSSSQNLELQQRSCEYLGLPEMGIDVMEEVLKEMPSFPEDRESGPEARLRRRWRLTTCWASVGRKTTDKRLPNNSSSKTPAGVTATAALSLPHQQQRWMPTTVA